MKKIVITSNREVSQEFTEQLKKCLYSKEGKFVAVNLPKGQTLDIKTVDVPRRSFWEWLV